MTRVVLGPTGTQRRRWTLIAPFCLIVLVGLLISAGSQAALPTGGSALFELDKDATNDQVSEANANRSLLPLGQLGQAITNASPSINVCRTTGAFEPSTSPSGNFTIQIEAEQMIVTAAANGSFGGGCQGTKRTYSVTRGANGTTAASHQANGDNSYVSLLTTVAGKPGADWSQIVPLASGNTDPKCAGLGFIECAFVHDGIGATIFTGGSTKDDLPFSGWRHKNGSVPPKSEIINAYAAKDTTADGPDPGTDPDQVLYVGADRYAVDGATDMGFWFVKDPNFGPNPIPAGQNEGTFSGTHTEGDVLLLSTFTQGGATTSIRVFKWTDAPPTGPSAGDGPGQINAIFGDCVPGVADMVGCATVNDTTIKAHWEYVATIDSAQVGGWIPLGGFLEAGVNLSDLGLGGCFSSFLAETRSSPSIDSSLQEFAFGNFENCGANISITPDGVNEVGTPHTFTVQVKAGVSGGETGIAGVNPTVTLTRANNTTLTPTTNNCAAPGGTGADGKCTVIFSSSTADVITGNASATVSFGGGTFNVSTNGQAGNSGPAVKRFVDANVLITPSGVNEVGTAHTFTVTTTASPSGTTASLTSLTPSVSPSTTILGSTCGTPTTPAGQPDTRTCTFSINSSSAGTFTANATAVWGFSGSGTPSSATVTRSTSGNSGPGGSGPATKRFVDALVSITPSGVNEVGTPHTFTVSTTADPQGTTASLTSLTPSVSPSTTLIGSTCGNPTTPAGQPNTRTCTFSINSSSAATFTANATAIWGFTGTGTPSSATVTRTTDGTHGSTGSATKRFVDALVSITPSGVNEVGTAHTFTVSTTADPQGTTASLTSLTPSVSPSTTILGSTCGNPTTPAGQPNTRTCTFSINSSSAATFTANATAIWHFAGPGTPSSADVTRTTDGTHGSSGSATKRFVDANITIGPGEATNVVGDPHTFTITVQQDDGLPAGAPGDGTTGFGPPAIGTQVTVTLANDATSNYQLISDGCVGVGGGTDANGQCFVVFTSPTAGTVTGNASVQFLLGGVLLTRDTDPNTPATSGPGGSGPAIKHFVAGSIRWSKVDNAGNLQGGATFELCQTHKYDIGTNTFVLIVDQNNDPDPDCMTVADDLVDDAPAGLAGDKFADDGTIDEDPAAGKFLVSGLSLGRYTVHETVAPPGFEADPDTKTVELTPNDPGPPPVNNTDKTIATAFVNSRPILKISGFGYTNEATGTPTSGVLSGTTTFTANLKNYGTADAVLAASSQLEVTSDKTQGTVSCLPSNPLLLTGTIAKNGGTGGPYSVTCTYTGLNDGAHIKATLNVDYTTNGMTRAASGSPATIEFTVQGD